MRHKYKMKLQQGHHYNSNGFKYDVSTLEFNTLVTCATVQMNRNWRDWRVTGYLIQVRKNLPKYGNTHLFFIRRCDGSLYTFHNEAVYVLDPEGIAYVQEFFPSETDVPDKEYTLKDKAMRGFVVNE